MHMASVLVRHCGCDWTFASAILCTNDLMLQKVRKQHHQHSDSHLIGEHIPLLHTTGRSRQTGACRLDERSHKRCCQGQEGQGRGGSCCKGQSGIPATNSRTERPAKTWIRRAAGQEGQSKEEGRRPRGNHMSFMHDLRRCRLVMNSARGPTHWQYSHRLCVAA